MVVYIYKLESRQRERDVFTVKKGESDKAKAMGRNVTRRPDKRYLEPWEDRFAGRIVRGTAGFESQSFVLRVDAPDYAIRIVEEQPYVYPSQLRGTKMI
jgi:hypothetical protein